MTNIEAFKANHQSIYLNQENALACAINMLDFGYQHFDNSYINQNLGKLEEISLQLEHGIEPKIDNCKFFIINNLIDNIRISICFENFFKAFLLSNLNVIHKLDKVIFPLLSKQQYKRPVEINEILKSHEWTINKTISDSTGRNSYQIQGIQQNTINYSTILNKPCYFNTLNINEDIRTILIGINDSRNKLHLQISQSILFTKESYENHVKLKEFLDKNINSTRTKMMDVLKIPKDKRKLTITTTKTPS